MELKGVKRTVLDNGLVILTHKVPTAKKAVLLVGVKVGSINEDDKLNGGSHFNEHLLFKSNAHRTAKQITETLELGGAAIGASTGFDKTIFHVKCLPEGLSEAINVAHQAAANLTFNPEEFKLEQQVILTEIQRIIEGPATFAANHLFFPTIFAGTSLEKTVSGTAKSMGTITAAELAAFKSAYYAPNNMVVVVVGQFDEQQTVKEVEKTFGTMPSFPDIHHPSIVVPPNKRYEKIETRPGLKQAYLYLGYRMPNEKHPDTFKLQILDGIFSAGLSTRMFQELRVKRGIGYAVGSSYGDVAGFGIFTTTVSGFDPSRFLETREVILGQFADLKINLISDKELDIARNLIISQHGDSIEEITNVARGLLSTEMENPVYDFRELEQYLRQITKQDVLETARQYLTDEFTLTALVPEDFKMQ